jgi:hypothetical protein
MSETEKGAPDRRPIPNAVYHDGSEPKASLLSLQASRLARLYAVNASMAETLAPLVFLEAMR